MHLNASEASMYSILYGQACPFIIFKLRYDFFFLYSLYVISCWFTFCCWSSMAARSRYFFWKSIVPSCPCLSILCLHFSILFKSPRMDNYIHSRNVLFSAFHDCFLLLTRISMWISGIHSKTSSDDQGSLQCSLRCSRSFTSRFGPRCHCMSFGH